MFDHALNVIVIYHTKYTLKLYITILFYLKTNYASMHYKYEYLTINYYSNKCIKINKLII